MKAVTESFLISFSPKQTNPDPLVTHTDKGLKQITSQKLSSGLIPVCQQVSSLSMCLLHWWAQNCTVFQMKPHPFLNKGNNHFSQPLKYVFIYL